MIRERVMPNYNTTKVIKRIYEGYTCNSNFSNSINYISIHYKGVHANGQVEMYSLPFNAIVKSYPDLLDSFFDQFKVPKDGLSFKERIAYLQLLEDKYND